MVPLTSYTSELSKEPVVRKTKREKKQRICFVGTKEKYLVSFPQTEVPFSIPQNKLPGSFKTIPQP